MRKALLSGLLTSTLLAALVSGAGPAGADPAGGGTAGAFGLTATVTTSTLIPPTPEAAVSAPPFATDNDSTTIPIDADPLAINGTLIARAAVHQNADLATELETETQAVAGPYNARAVGAVEDLNVVIDAIETDVSLIEADVLRSEVVAKCVGDTAEYSANSEDLNLEVAGETALGDALDDLIDALLPGLDPLAPIIDFEQNVITDLGDGLAVDALVVSVLAAVDATAPLIQVRVGHSELSGVTCGALPECSDTTDNDGDGVIDADDPGCHTDGDPDNPDSYDPEDDDESDGAECSDGIDNDGDGEIDFPDDNGCDSPDDDDESDDCSDGVDNDGDGVADIDDPGCHTDGDANNPDSYDPNDDDETDASRALPTTGASVPTATAVALGLAGLALVALRRRSEA